MPKKVITPAKKVAPTKVAPTKVAIKKVVIKAVVKNTTATTTRAKVPTKKVLVVADNAHSFWLHDGQILNSLTSLAEALRVMNAAVFIHHVKVGRNDFAEWVETVLGDKTCATDLRKAKTPKTAYTAVAKQLKAYKL